MNMISKQSLFVLQFSSLLFEGIISIINTYHRLIPLIKILYMSAHPGMLVAILSVVCRGGRTGRRPRASKAGGASKEWNYYNLNAVTQWFSNFFWSRTICVSHTVITYHLVPGKVNVPNIMRSKVWKTRIDTNATWTKWLWEILMAIFRKQQGK